MKKLSRTKVIALIGIAAWGLTIFLRGTSVTEIEPVNFILGVMPNFSAALFFTAITEDIMLEKYKKNSSLKLSVIISCIIFSLGLASEIVHALYLNSAFDINDMIATIVSLAIYSVISYLSNRNS